MLFTDKMGACILLDRASLQLCMQYSKNNLIWSSNRFELDWNFWLDDLTSEMSVPQIPVSESFSREPDGHHEIFQNFRNFRELRIYKLISINYHEIICFHQHLKCFFCKCFIL